MNDFCLFEDSELRPCEQQAMDCDMCEYNELFQIAVAKAKEEVLRDYFSGKTNNHSIYIY